MSLNSNIETILLSGTSWKAMQNNDDGDIEKTLKKEKSTQKNSTPFFH